MKTYVIFNNITHVAIDTNSDDADKARINCFKLNKLEIGVGHWDYTDSAWADKHRLDYVAPQPNGGQDLGYCNECNAPATADCIHH
jgi:hypothetical protein